MIKPQQSLCLICLCLIWGSSWMAQEALHGAIPPLRFAALALLLGAILLVPVMQWRRMRWPCGSELQASLSLSLTMIALPAMLIVGAARYASFSDYALIFAATPLLLTFLSSWMHRGNSVPRSAWQAMIVALGGVMLMLPAGISLSLTEKQCAGICFVLFSMLLQAGSYLYAKRTLSAVQPVVSAAIQLFFAGIILALSSIPLERGMHSTWSATSLVTLILSGVLSESVAYTLLYALIRGLKVYQVSSVYVFVPFISIAEGAILLRQPPTWNMYVGAAVIFGSGLFVILARSEPEETLELRLNR